MLLIVVVVITITGEPTQKYTLIGLAFAGLIYTIVLQKQDLELQRNEIALNRAELKKTAKAQQHSEKALIQQVEQMKLASKLNALKILIDYYNIQIANPNNSPEVVAKSKEKRKMTIQEIDRKSVV